VVAVVLGGCGGDDKGDTAAKPDVVVTAEDALKFDKTSYEATTDAKGEVTIEYKAGGTLTHTLLIKGVDNDDFELRVTGSGSTDTGTVKLDPGDYTLYCDIPGHQNMKATLTVG
jgi:plastocyanin